MQEYYITTRTRIKTGKGYEYKSKTVKVLAENRQQAIEKAKTL